MLLEKLLVLAMLLEKLVKNLDLREILEFLDIKMKQLWLEEISEELMKLKKEWAKEQPILLSLPKQQRTLLLKLLLVLQMQKVRY